MKGNTQFSGTTWELLHKLCKCDCLKIKQKTWFEVVPRGSSRLKEKELGTTSKTLHVFLRVRPFRNRELGGNYLGTWELPRPVSAAHLSASKCMHPPQCKAKHPTAQAPSGNWIGMFGPLKCANPPAREVHYE